MIQNNIPGLSMAPSTLHGQEYLSGLPTAVADQIKRGISEGRLTMPSATTRSQAAIQLRNAVMQYDPDFSEQARSGAQKAFTTGKDGSNIGSLNTASVHLDQLGEAADALKNNSFVPGNSAYNYFSTMFGGAPPNNFNTLKAAVAGELANALKGTATDPEIHTISQNINQASSPEQLKGAVDTNLHILGAKLKTYHERYKQQIPNDNVWSPVLPSARGVYLKHGFDPVQAAPANARGAQTVNPNPNGYVKGHSYGGLIYNGPNTTIGSADLCKQPRELGKTVDGNNFYTPKSVPVAGTSHSIGICASAADGVAISYRSAARRAHAARNA